MHILLGNDKIGVAFMNDPNFTSPWPLPQENNGLSSSYNQNFPACMNIFPIYPVPENLPMFPLYGYDNIFEAEKDMEYTKLMYPVSIRRIQTEVEEECDQLEQDGSCMFDQYLDRVQLSMITSRIYDRVKDINFDNASLKAQNLNSQRPCIGGNCPPPPPPPRPCRGRNCPPPRPCYGRNCPPPRSDYQPDGQPNWLKNLIEALLYNEMNNRRRRYRSRKRWF